MVRVLTMGFQPCSINSEISCFKSPDSVDAVSKRLLRERESWLERNVAGREMGSVRDGIECINQSINQ